MEHALFNAPCVEAFNILALADRNDAVLMPAEVPIGCRCLVKDDGSHSKARIAKHCRHEFANLRRGCEVLNCGIFQKIPLSESIRVEGSIQPRKPIVIEKAGEQEKAFGFEVIGIYHQPDTYRTTPCSGELAVAYSFLGMRPAR